MASIEHRLADIRQDWFRRGFSFEYWIDPPGQVWREFVHEIDELLMLVEGEIELDLDGETARPALGGGSAHPRGR
jgi:hypothetical protein